MVVQIGSNDGKTGDPLYHWLMRKKGWSGVFVEPVPFFFDCLKETYKKEDRFIFENAAINDGSKVSFYWVSEDALSALPDLPSTWNQLGGFSREHITSHIPELKPFIKKSNLRGLKLTDLFERHSLKKIDLLHIDTEGSDFKILSQLDLDRFQPRGILYEQIHLSEDEHSQSIKFLQDRYALFDLGNDMLAISKDDDRGMKVTLKSIQSLRQPYL